MKYLWELVRRCPYCVSSTVRRSRRQNLFEAIALPLLLLRPYRCQALRPSSLQFRIYQEGPVCIQGRSEEHTSELQSRGHLVCRLLLEKKKKNKQNQHYKTKNTK